MHSKFHDGIQQLGALALGSRLRRVSEPLMYDVAKVYKDCDVNFEPRWLPVYTCLLQADSPYSIMDIAEYLGVTQPAVSQITTQMLKKGWVVVSADKQDARKRLFCLTKEARECEYALKPIWNAVRESAESLIGELEGPLLEQLAHLEARLRHTSFYDRVSQRIQPPAERSAPMITVLEYTPSYRPYFELFNREWLEEFFVVEPYDQQVFDNPEKYILNEGGAIYFAQYEGDIVGTVALIPREEGVIELSKMGVTRKLQGLGIGKVLARHAIKQARLTGAHTLMLDSNRALKPAIALYHKLGFVEIPTDPNSPYERANIRMAMALTEHSWMTPDGIQAEKASVAVGSDE